MSHKKDILVVKDSQQNDLFSPDNMTLVKNNLTVKTRGIFNQLEAITSYDIYIEKKKEIKEAKAKFNKLIGEVDTARKDAKKVILEKEKELHTFTKGLGSEFDEISASIKVFEDEEYEYHVESIEQLILNEIYENTHEKAIISDFWSDILREEVALCPVVIERLPKTVYNISTSKNKIKEQVLDELNKIEADYTGLTKYIPDAFKYFIEAELEVSKTELLYKAELARLEALEAKQPETRVVDKPDTVMAKPTKTEYVMQNTETITLQFNAEDAKRVMQLLNENKITYIEVK